jgi:branched-chain amino acid transport system substrate-binding protein
MKTFFHNITVTCRLCGILAIIILCTFILPSCDNTKQPIRIGLSINLSGTGGAAGEHVRNGVLLAVNDINSSGGINGRPIEIIVQDDHGTVDGAVQADKRLIGMGVPVIVGHNMSSTTLAAYSLVTSSNVLLITGCTATSRLTGKDDLFFRTCVDCNLYGKKTAKLLESKGAASAVFIMDMSNPGFVTDYADATEKYYRGMTRRIKFKAGENEDWDVILSDLRTPDAVILLTEATTTGVALQKLKASGFKGIRIATLWAQTPELIRYAAAAGEGMSIITYINPEIDTESYRLFKKELEINFHQPANARSSSAYELMMILANAMKRADDMNGPSIARALREKTYSGIMGNVSFDRYGDVIRPVYEVTISNDRFRMRGDI